MDDQELQNLLEQLHREIERTRSVDEKGRALLNHLEADIHSLVERSGNQDTKQRASTVQRLEESIDYFGVSHPTLNAVLSKLMAILSNAGI
jgi:hypothetical protein